MKLIEKKYDGRWFLLLIPWCLSKKIRTNAGRKENEWMRQYEWDQRRWWSSLPLPYTMHQLSVGLHHHINKDHWSWSCHKVVIQWHPPTLSRSFGCQRDRGGLGGAEQGHVYIRPKRFLCHFKWEDVLVGVDLEFPRVPRDTPLTLLTLE